MEPEKAKENGENGHGEKGEAGRRASFFVGEAKKKEKT